MVQLEDVASAAPRARGLTLPAQCCLSLCPFCAAEKKQCIQLAILQQSRQWNSVSKHLSLTDSLEL